MKRTAAAIALAACAVVAASLWRMRANVPPAETAATAIVAEANLNWDEAEILSRKSGQVVLRNQTDSPIRVTDIRFTCGCINVTRPLDGKSVRVRTLDLPPRGSVSLLVELETRGLPGSPVRQRITFVTDRPDQQEVHVESLIKRVTGGVSGVPSALPLGRLVLGSIVTNEVEVVDSAECPRRIREVTSSHPNLLAAELLSTPHAPYLEKGQKVGTVIGRLRLRFLCNELGMHRAKALVHLAEESRAPDQVEVSAEVVPAVELSPSCAVLPRRVQDRDEYHTQISCRSILGKVEQGKLLSQNSDPFQVEFQPDVNSGTLELLLRADAAWSRKLGGKKVPPLELQFLVEGKWHVVHLPVSFHR